ncbi:MAG: hypothetical protein KDK25_06995 [Leptospiraceae bacterium]|nr:hypothetical protein [Leptospiraceae bacterium]
MKSSLIRWPLALFLLLFLTPLFSRASFSTRERVYEATDLRPVMGEAAYLQTYQNYVDAPLFGRMYPSLRLLIAFRGDVRFFAILYDGQPLVAGIRSHRPDAMPGPARQFLREYVSFRIDLEGRKHSAGFLLLEPRPGQEDTSLYREECKDEIVWKELPETGPLPLHPAQWEAELKTGSACAAPSMFYHWLEYLRATYPPSRTEHPL